jgi:hypothetical protein
MPTAAGAKGDIVLSAPTDSIDDILNVLTKDDYEGELRELSGPEETSALIVRTIGENQTTRELTPSASELIMHFYAPFSRCIAPTITTIHPSGISRYPQRERFTLCADRRPLP